MNNYEEEILKKEETPLDYLTRICYIRNFDPLKNFKEQRHETNILRGTMENLIEREEDRRVGSTWVTSKEEQ